MSPLSITIKAARGPQGKAPRKGIGESPMARKSRRSFLLFMDRNRSWETPKGSQNIIL